MTSIPNPPPALDKEQRPKEPNAFLQWIARIFLLSTTGLLFSVMILVLLILLFQLGYQDKIIPNVYVGNVPVGGLSAEEAYEAIGTALPSLNTAVYTFRYGDQFWQYNAQDLGLTHDVESSLAQAAAIGHNPNILLNVVDQAQVWMQGVSLAPVLTYDQNKASAILQTIADQINQTPISATLSFDGHTVTTTAARAGLSLDIASTLFTLNDYMMNLQSGAEIPLVVHEQPPAVKDVSLAASRIETAISAPISLVASDAAGQPLGPWQVSPADLAKLIRVELVPLPDEEYEYSVSFDAQAFEASLNTLAPGLIIPARDGRFHFNKANQSLELIQPSISGRELNITETLASLESAVFSVDNRVVPLSFTYLLPMYHNQISASELGISELVAESTTYFTGSSSNRRTNIAVSASKIDGTIIPPGAEFSFNTLLGEIAYENGFVDGLVIFGGKTTSGIGGGVCQVSTTIFRAALVGGYPIIERNTHGYRVGYYELGGSAPGLDAAIWQPERDFRFLNDTPYHLLIEANVYPAESALTLRIYSTPTGRRVEIEDAVVKNIEPAPPPVFNINSDLRNGDILQLDYAADGADVTVYRNIYNTEGELINRDHIYTHYLPWQAIYEVAPGDPRARN
ncbi:VanW family protein [Anaerolineales bacterium]